MVTVATGQQAERVSPHRKGARRVSEVSRDLKALLEGGAIESATLVECLAMDLGVLLRAVFPDAAQSVYAQVDAMAETGIVKRMVSIGQLLWAQYGEEGVAYCRLHTSDMVRGWACFMLATSPMTLNDRLAAISALADDTHFGVREWAWLAMRPHLAAELDASIALLSAWTDSPSPNIRRFACESIRPRGVWCAHINVLKSAPEKALPVLEPLAMDSSVYVQDSVANWLNDAAKHQPEWVKATCARWLGVYPGAATQRICHRALRSLN